MKIQRIHLKDQDYERKIFVDQDSGDVYRRIYIGFAWPYLTKPGFICVMAEEDKRDFSIPYGPRHLRILAEHETDDIESLSRHLQKFKEDFCQASIIGNNQNPLREIMEQYQVRIPLIPPLDSEGIRHPVPIESARVFRLIPPPLVGA